MSVLMQAKDRILAFVESCRVDDAGRYRYSPRSSTPVLYASCYAAMTRSLLGDLDRLTASQRQTWIDYLQSHQDDDGLFRDDVIFGQGWYADDPLWCGRSHLTCHVIIALTCLGGVAKKPFAWLKSFDDIEAFLASREWGANVACSGNEIMNVGTLLQYARDQQHDDRAADKVERLLHWLSQTGVNPQTGLWGALDVDRPKERSELVQAAYHWWTLFFYDAVPIPYMDRAIDVLLAMQNPLGGFGWGVHNWQTPLHSSACEDIDSIEPLVRCLNLTSYRREEILAVLRRAESWVATNQADDGGFVFMRDVPFEYGHPAMSTGPGEGAMFPTWFRTLCLAYVDRALGGPTWTIIRCPGYQFWSA